MIILYISIAIVFLITFGYLALLTYIREKNKDRYIYFNGPFSSCSILMFGLSLIAMLSITAQQNEGRIGVEIYYSFIFLIPFIIVNFFGVLKTILFRVEIKKKSCYVRSSFGITRQFAYSKLQYKRKWHILLILYYEGKKYIYFANECLTPGIDDIYVKLKNLDYKTSI